MTKNEENWLATYNMLQDYISQHGHLPDKHKVEYRSLLSWAKYQRKRIRAGLMPEHQQQLFLSLMETRSSEHTGGRRPRNIGILELTEYTQEQFQQLQSLISQLTSRVTLTQQNLAMVLADPNSHLYVLVESSRYSSQQRIIGCATLGIFHSPTGRKASIEDVVIDNEYRGQHLGRRLMEHILQQASSYAPIDLYLTSNPKRIAANALYQSLGFQRKETNCYKLSIIVRGA